MCRPRCCCNVRRTFLQIHRADALQSHCWNKGRQPMTNRIFRFPAMLLGGILALPLPALAAENSSPPRVVGRRGNWTGQRSLRASTSICVASGISTASAKDLSLDDIATSESEHCDTSCNRRVWRCCRLRRPLAVKASASAARAAALLASSNVRRKKQTAIKPCRAL